MKPLLAVLMLLFAAGGAEQKHRYIFVYTVSALTPNIQTAVMCGEPGCNNVYHNEERHRWYETLPEALKSMTELTKPRQISNFSSGTLTHFGGSLLSTEEERVNEVIGLYEVTQIPAKLVQTGTEKHPVQKTVEEDVPVMEWQVKPATEPISEYQPNKTNLFGHGCKNPKKGLGDHDEAK